MSPPRFLDTSVCPYNYSQLTGLTDVETGGVGIISKLRTKLVTDLGWTEPTSNLFKSPSDPVGRWLDVLCTRISATNIEFRVRDNLGRTVITRRVQISGGGSTVNFFCGKFYAIVEVVGTPEVFQAFICETTQDLTLYYPNAIFANAYRNASDANDGNGDAVGELFGFEVSTPVFRNRVCAISQLFDNTVWARFTLPGSMMVDEFILFSAIESTDSAMTGRMWHTWIVDTSIAGSTDLALPADEGGVSATFRTINLAGSNNARIAIRKSDP